MTLKWWLLISLAVISPLVSLLFGAAQLSPSDVALCLTSGCTDSINTLVFWDIRFPRVAIGFLVGAGLAVAGATLQNVTRNSLADPYLFGVVSGAGLGASISTLFFTNAEPDSLAASISLPASAFMGALFSVLLVQLLTLSTFGRRTEYMLLAGVAVSFMLSAISQFLLYLGEPFAATRVVFWLMGSLARAEAWYAWLMLPILTLSIGVILLFGRQIDALLLGDSNAKTLGVNVTALRTLSLIVCAALTSCIVAYCGGIGFVGLMIPHIVRNWLGVTSRTLIIGSVLLGGAFMVWVDVFARIALKGQEIPIGIITSAIGSVFFIIAMSKQGQ
ncbi:iron ABC transporter permease [Alteromonas sp. 5E99-2]|uniref:iron chelate uptake ABC transporter family permease subunit n=1 Tax=Alteromonas sp. 5E99-2 TaxID=2817683 RepID=UPI001A97D3C2|nr:iron ABC transporter permease [Alteromonas sp. 5E99-2]